MPEGNPVYSKDLVAIWEECVWQDKAIRECTELIHPCDVVGTQEATCDLKKIMYCGEINFAQYFIQRFKAPEIGGCCTYNYRVIVEYYLEDSCENQNKIQEFFEILDNVIEAQLGNNWKGHVDGFTRDTTWPNIRRFGTLNNTLVYVGSFTYFAEASSSNCI